MFVGGFDFVREPNRSRARSFARWHSRETLAKNKHGGNLVSTLATWCDRLFRVSNRSAFHACSSGHQWMLFFLTPLGTILLPCVCARVSEEQVVLVCRSFPTCISSRDSDIS